MTRRLPEPETRSREDLERSQSCQRDTVQRVSEAPRRVGEGVNESFGPIVPAVPASILFFARKHAPHGDVREDHAPQRRRRAIMRTISTSRAKRTHFKFPCPMYHST